MSLFKKWFSSKESKAKDFDTVSPGNTSRMSHMELLVLVVAPESTKTKEELMKLGASANSRSEKNNSWH